MEVNLSLVLYLLAAIFPVKRNLPCQLFLGVGFFFLFVFVLLPSKVKINIWFLICQFKKE